MHMHLAAEVNAEKVRWRLASGGVKLAAAVPSVLTRLFPATFSSPPLPAATSLILPPRELPQRLPVHHHRRTAATDVILITFILGSNLRVFFGLFTGTGNILC